MPNQRNTPSSSQAPSRQSTESSQPEPLRTRTTTGFKSLTVARSQTPVKDVKEDWYEVYHLPWSRLKAWLEQRFPGHTFEERVGVASPFAAGGANHGLRQT